MDGLTISNSDMLLERGQSAREINRSRLAPEQPVVAPGDSKAPSFAETLKAAINEVNTLQKASDIKMQELATGKTKDVSEVMIAAERADIALKLMVQVRNKVIDAYNEIMKMQV